VESKPEPEPEVSEKVHQEGDRHAGVLEALSKRPLIGPRSSPKEALSLDRCEGVSAAVPLNM
jgi:hypothetical protein